MRFVIPYPPRGPPLCIRPAFGVADHRLTYMPLITRRTCAAPSVGRQRSVAAVSKAKRRSAGCLLLSMGAPGKVVTQYVSAPKGTLVMPAQIFHSSASRASVRSQRRCSLHGRRCGRKPAARPRPRIVRRASSLSPDFPSSRRIGEFDANSAAGLAERCAGDQRD